ncbi:MAG: hypothetical protein IID44_23595 [Planctomycetes bacterium]|nr:hypothetical protein [Planctomycetota bacterium]
MLRFFFWNQYCKDLTHVVVEAAKTMRPDILAFCETGCPSRDTLQALESAGDYHFTTGRVGERFHIFTRFSHRYIEVRKESDRFLILEVKLPARDRFLLMLLHGPSKGAGWTPISQALEMSRYVSALRDTQRECNLERSVIVGDFNMNPFEPGMVGAVAFNAVMDARQARKGDRTVQRRSYGYFYNPMWNLFGDKTPGPPATLFYDGHTQDELQWHMLDQVIVSPEMIDDLNVDSIRIVDAVGDYRLVTSGGRPWKSKFSDHLPLFFELNV